MNSPEETAALIAVAFQRSNLKRSKLSMSKLQVLSGRKRCSAPFIVNVMKAIEDNDIVMVEIDTGGFGLMYNSALEGAKNLQVSILLTEDEIKSPHTPELLKELTRGF